MGDYFTIALHHGGLFQDLPNVSYVGGEVNYWDDVDPDRMSLPKLWKIIKQVGYLSYDNVYYLLSGRTLDNKLMELKIDEHCIQMLEAIRGHDELHIYVEHTISEPKVVEEPNALLGVKEVGVMRAIVDEDNVHGSGDKEYNRVMVKLCSQVVKTTYNKVVVKLYSYLAKRTYGKVMVKLCN